MLPSKKQQALLDYIDAFIKENNYAPSYREVMRALDYKSVSTVAKHINGLIERGWMVKRENSARSVEVVYKTGKAGQTPVIVGQSSGSSGQTPPTPSLPVSYQAWLESVVDKRFLNAVNPLANEERQIIIAALELLGFSELAQTYEPTDQT